MRHLMAQPARGGQVSVLGPRFNSSEYLKYACGLNLGPALILNQNPIFEMVSNIRIMHMKTFGSCKIPVLFHLIVSRSRIYKARRYFRNAVIGS
jgi:hypothetical protein